MNVIAAANSSALNRTEVSSKAQLYKNMDFVQDATFWIHKNQVWRIISDQQYCRMRYPVFCTRTQDNSILGWSLFTVDWPKLKATWYYKEKFNFKMITVVLPGIKMNCTIASVNPACSSGATVSGWREREGAELLAELLSRWIIRYKEMFFLFFFPAVYVWIVVKNFINYRRFKCLFVITAVWIQ